MPYKTVKQNCKRSDGKKGKYVLKYKPKKPTKKKKDSQGYVKAGCHTSKKKAAGQRAAIEGGPINSSHDKEQDILLDSILETIEKLDEKEDQNKDGKNDFDDVKIARMKASGMSDSEIKKKYPKLFESDTDEAKKKLSKTANPNYYVGKKTRKTKSNKQMEQEINKCKKKPTPKSCYDEWSADKTYKAKKNESIEIDDLRILIRETIEELNEAEKLSKSVEDKIRKIANDRGYTFGSMKAEYKKGLAAWLTGHRQGVSQHQWATARIKKCTESQSWSGCKKSKSKKK